MNTGLRRNKVKFYYATPVSGTDEYGNAVECASWSNPIEACANISPQSGGTQYQPFGIVEPYDRIINPLPKSFPMNAKLHLWVDTMPTLAVDGSTTTPHDYEVRLPAEALSHRFMTIKRVS